MAPQLPNATENNTNPQLIDPLSAWETVHAATSDRNPSRGVAWVLRGAFVLAVFSVAGVIFSQQLMLTIAEQYLVQAAKAGAREATLPRATVASVTNVVAQRWKKWNRDGSLGDSQLRVAVRSENRALRGLLPRELKGSIRIEVAVPASAVLPRWLLPRGLVWGPRLIRATANG